MRERERERERERDEDTSVLTHENEMNGEDRKRKFKARHRLPFLGGCNELESLNTRARREGKTSSKGH